MSSYNSITSLGLTRLWAMHWRCRAGWRLLYRLAAHDKFTGWPRPLGATCQGPSTSRRTFLYDFQWWGTLDRALPDSDQCAEPAQLDGDHWMEIAAQDFGSLCEAQVALGYSGLLCGASICITFQIHFQMLFPDHFLFLWVLSFSWSLASILYSRSENLSSVWFKQFFYI